MVLAWNNEITITPDITTTKYGKTGIERRGFKGINNANNTINISVKILNWVEVTDFLRGRKNQPFRLSANDNDLYICKEWSISLEGKIGELSAEFEQIRRF